MAKEPDHNEHFVRLLAGCQQDVLRYVRLLDPIAAPFFFLDGGYLVADHQSVEQVLKFLQVSFRKVGLELNMTKL